MGGGGSRQRTTWKLSKQNSWAVAAFDWPATQPPTWHLVPATHPTVLAHRGVVRLLPLRGLDDCGRFVPNYPALLAVAFPLTWPAWPPLPLHIVLTPR